MLDIKYIREHVEEVKKNSENRLVSVDIDLLLKIDQEKRELEAEIEDLRAKRNKASKTKPTEAEIAEMKEIGNRLHELERKLAPISEKFVEIMGQVPNLTHPAVKVSKNEEDNIEVEVLKKPTEFEFKAKDHVELAEKLDLIDFDRGAKGSGTKFYFLKNELVLLEMALARYAFDVALKHKYTPFATPDLAKREILESMGYNPRGDSTQVYNIDKSDLSLIGTAEITMGGYHKDEIFELTDLPKKYVAISHCFRTEAGSYSKYSKGIFRVHQFTKVELFQYTLPEESEKAHYEILDIEKEIFKGLGIPVRVVDHCTADLGAPSYRTFDLEAWMPGKPNEKGGTGDWAEITSTSNCTDYQSRTLNIKYKKEDGGKEYVHMLNGTAIAMTRPIIAILENFQQKDGSIKIPEVLWQYLPFKVISK